MSAASRTDPDLTPLPVWRQYLARYRDAWRRSRDRRTELRAAFVSTASAMLAIAISGAGAILIAYGVHEIYRPAGYVTGGLMCWLLLWSHERDREGGR